MKAFITGASGFAGPHLIAHLHACGDEVVASDRRGPDPLDILDRRAVHDRLQRDRPDVVYHLAAFTQVGESWNQPDHVLRINVEGTLHVLDAARAAGVARGRRDRQRRGVRPRVRVRPADRRGRRRCDRTRRTARARSPRRTSRCRRGSVPDSRRSACGPSTTPDRASCRTSSSRRWRNASSRPNATARDEIVVGNLDPVRDVNDVRDIVRAYRLLATEGTPGEVYNICSGTGVSVAEIADLLIARAERPVHLVQDPALVRPVETPRLVGDASKLHAATGWKPEYTLSQTLTDVLDAARSATPDG